MYKRYYVAVLVLVLLFVSSCNYNSDIHSFGNVDNSLIERPTFSPSSGTTFEKTLEVNIINEDSQADIFYWRESEVPKFMEFFKAIYSLLDDNNPDSCEDSFKVIADAKLDPDYFAMNALKQLDNLNECQNIIRGFDDAPQFEDYIIQDDSMKKENFDYCVSVLDNFTNIVEPNSEKFKELAVSLDSELLTNCLDFFKDVKDQVNKEFSNHEYKKPIALYDSEIILALAYKEGLWSNGFSSAIYKRSSGGLGAYSDSFMEFTAPENNQHFDLNEQLNFNAISSTDEVLDRVEFYKDGELFKFDSVAPYSFDWNSNTSGTFLFEARGFLVNGSNASAFVHVRVDSGIYVDLSADSWSVNEKDSFNLVCESMEGADLVLKIDNSVVKSGKDKIEYSSNKAVGSYDVECFAKKDGLEISDKKELVIFSVEDAKEKDLSASNFNFSKNLSELTREELLNITNFSIQNNFVKVEYLESLKIQRDLPISGNMYLANHSVFINSNNLFEFDKKAHIIFYDVEYNAPIVFKDGLRCSNADCFARRYDRDNNIYEMNVLGFSNYSIGDHINSGGSRSHIDQEQKEETICVPKWQCMTLSECKDGYVELSCFDTNKCGVSMDRPEPKVTCEEAKKIMEKQTKENPASVILPEKEVVVDKKEFGKEIPDGLVGDKEGSSNLMLFLGIGIFIVIILAVLFFFVFKKDVFSKPTSNFKIKPDFEKKCFDYLDRMRGLGYEDDFIKQKMEASGYTQDLVEYLFRKYK